MTPQLYTRERPRLGAPPSSLPNLPQSSAQTKESQLLGVTEVLGQLAWPHSSHMSSCTLCLGPLPTFPPNTLQGLPDPPWGPPSRVQGQLMTLVAL